jgi:Swt1-like HEPN/NPCBM/NEW2 domain
VELSNRDLVGKAFELLAEGLEPFVEYHVKGVVPGGMDWGDWLSKRLYKRNSGMTVSKTDPLVLLRVIVQEEKVFKDVLSRAERSHAQELWECRNNWAHNAVFNESDTQRLLDTIERLLRAAGAVIEADRVQQLLRDHRRAGAERRSPQPLRPDGHPGVNGHGATPASGSTGGHPRSQWPAGSFSRLRNSVTVLGLPIGIFAVLVTLGLIILPSATLPERTFIVGTSLALSGAALTGAGAWRSMRRFAATAAAGGLAIVCLGGLSIAASSHVIRERAPSAGNHSMPANHGVGGSPSVAASSASASASSTASGNPAARSSLHYLANLVGNSGDTETPTTGSWIMQGRAYSISIGYPGLWQEESVTYQLKRSYSKFAATVGVNDDADPTDHDTPIEFTVYGNPNGQSSTVKLGDITEQWGKTKLFNVNINGATTLTLVTTLPTNADLISSSSVAVWGNAHLALSP